MCLFTNGSICVATTQQKSHSHIWGLTDMHAGFVSYTCTHMMYLLVICTRDSFIYMRTRANGGLSSECLRLHWQMAKTQLHRLGSMGTILPPILFTVCVLATATRHIHTPDCTVMNCNYCSSCLVCSQRESVCVCVFVCVCMSIDSYEGQFPVQYHSCEDILTLWQHLGWSSQIQRSFWGLRLGFRVRIKFRLGLQLGLG